MVEAPAQEVIASVGAARALKRETVQTPVWATSRFPSAISEARSRQGASRCTAIMTGEKALTVTVRKAFAWSKGRRWNR